MSSLKVYSVLDGFVGKLTYDRNSPPAKKSSKINTKDCETIVILDISGSMGDQVQRLAQRIIPETLKRLGYEAQDPITLITFESTAKLYRTKVGEIAKLGLHCAGSTYLVGALKYLSEVVNGLKPSVPIRLLTLSDGCLNDQENSVQTASELAPIFAGRQVSSKAIRYFTSLSQPDTRGLASVLQFDNTGSSGGLVDLEARGADDTTLASKISEQFENDGLDGPPTFLKISPGALALLLPWDENASDQVRLTNGENVFWLKELPQSVSIDDKPVEIEQMGALALENWEAILTKLKGLVYRLKILRVVNSETSRREIENAKVYLEKWLKSVEESGQKLLESERQASPALLRHRLDVFKDKLQRQLKGVYAEFSQYLNDDKIEALNSAQQASYLRSLGGGKTSKALARRAMKDGIDFGDVLQTEVRAMRKHLHELAGVDDSNHVRSFFSLATTLDGIRAICELYDDEEAFSMMEPMDILQIVNIVGIACNAPVGDFPDPQTWRVNKIHPGCYVSVSDLIVAFEQSGTDDHLTVPQTTEPITSVIPYFEDDKIQQFLQTHAPDLLEYTCSVGMRNVLAGVPKTYLFTLASGLWKLVQELNANKFEVSIQSFCRLIANFDKAQGNSFYDILRCIRDQSPNDDGKLLSFYLANNGTASLIGPMITLAKKGQLHSPLLPRILRALYSHEYYLGVRRFLKTTNTEHLPEPQFAEAKLHSLLGIDLAKYGTPVGELFEADNPNPVFHSQYHLNEEAYDVLAKFLWYVDNVALLPELIERAFRVNPVEEVKSLPKYGKAEISKALGISFPLQDFKFYTIVQAMIFDSQSKRFDEKLGRMKILDFGIRGSAENFIADLVRSVYEDEYKKAINRKRAKEAEVIAEQLVEMLLTTPHLQTFKEHLAEGLKLNARLHRITGRSSVGFTKLHDGLLNVDVDVPERLEKIRILLTGRDSAGNTVWNRGGVLFVDRLPFEKVYSSLNAEGKWQEIVDVYKTARHVYREGKPNRHGHSNDKPSYWALGYPSIQAYFATLSEEAQKDYAAEHVNCCGLRSMQK